MRERKREKPKCSFRESLFLLLHAISKSRNEKEIWDALRRPPYSIHAKGGEGLLLLLRKKKSGMMMANTHTF